MSRNDLNFISKIRENTSSIEDIKSTQKMGFDTTPIRRFFTVDDYDLNLTISPNSFGYANFWIYYYYFDTVKYDATSTLSLVISIGTPGNIYRGSQFTGVSMRSSRLAIYDEYNYIRYPFYNDNAYTVNLYLKLYTVTNSIKIATSSSTG